MVVQFQILFIIEKMDSSTSYHEFVYSYQFFVQHLRFLLRNAVMY